MIVIKKGIKMSVSKEELLHIADLADLKIDENEIEIYNKNLEEILDYAKVINDISLDDLNETIGANENYNVFRKDEVKEFDNVEGLLSNNENIERNMYKIPNVL